MKEDYNAFSELLLIIGGFILAETVIRWFLSLSESVLPKWILPALSILLIMTALDIKKTGVPKSVAGIISILFLTISIILIVLMGNSIISAINFLWTILVLSIISILAHIVIFFISRRKKENGNC